MRAVVVSMAKILNILGKVTEEEDVILANFTGDFDLELSAYHTAYRNLIDSRWLRHKYQ